MASASMSSALYSIVIESSENDLRKGYLIKSHDDIHEIYDDDFNCVINTPIPRKNTEKITQKQFWFLCGVNVSERIEKMKSKQGQFLKRLRVNEEVFFKTRNDGEWMKGRFVAVNEKKELSILFRDKRNQQRTALVPIWEVFPDDTPEDEIPTTSERSGTLENVIAESSTKKSIFRIAEQGSKTNKPFVCAEAENGDKIIDWSILDNSTLVFQTMQHKDVPFDKIHIENKKGRIAADKILEIADEYLMNKTIMDSMQCMESLSTQLESIQLVTEQSQSISGQLSIPGQMKPLGLELGKEMMVKLINEDYVGIVKWTGIIDKLWFVGLEVQEKDLLCPIVHEHPQLLNKFPCSFGCSSVFVEAEFVRPIIEKDLRKLFFTIPHNQEYFENLVRDPDDDDLRIGWFVHVNLSIQKCQTLSVGICRWIGHHRVENDQLIGVELNHPIATGSTNGTFPNKNGIKLFECPTKCGVIVRRSSLRVPNLPISTEPDKNPCPGIKVFCNVPHDIEFMKLLIQQDDATPTTSQLEESNFFVKNKVQVSLMDAHFEEIPIRPTGECVFIGQHKNTKKYFIGVVLDEEINCEAVTDGTFPRQNGIKLFTCQDHKGVLLPLKRVHKFDLRQCEESMELNEQTTSTIPHEQYGNRQPQITMPNNFTQTSLNIPSVPTRDNQSVPNPRRVTLGEDGASMFPWDRYEKRGKLDRGCFGIVNLVYDKEFKTMKVCRKIPLKDDENENEKMLREAKKILDTLDDHLCLVKCHEFFSHGQSFYIVMENCEGGTLKTEIDKASKNGNKWFENNKIMTWFTNILNGVQFIHSCDIIHRDLMPKNIFLKDNVIKIGDFGLSRVLENCLDYVTTGAGASWYMSPEVYNDGIFTPKSDIWSLGCILYEMCALKPAFKRKTWKQTNDKICSAEYDPIPEHYSEEIIFLLAKMLVVYADERSSAQELLKLRLMKPYVASWNETQQNSMQVHERYIEKNQLGQGSFGVVWLVNDSRIDRLKPCATSLTPCSFKVRKHVLLDVSEEENEKIRREAEILVTLTHPFVVKYYEDYSLQNLYYIVMEYCECGTIRTIIESASKKKQKLDQQNVVVWITQLLIGLNFIHSQRIVHRDLYPPNIFLKENKVKIGDFGLSSKLGSSNNCATRHGANNYMGPEVLTDEIFTYKSDIWSVGCILYEMCALKIAFKGVNIFLGKYDPLPEDYSDVTDMLSMMLVVNASERLLTKDLLELPLIKSISEEIHQQTASLTRPCYVRK